LYDVKTDNALFGFDANDAAIGVEYCFGGNIDADQAYQRYVWVIACACFQFRLDPAKAVVGHFMLDPERKTDPLTGLARSRRTYDQLLRDVVSEYHSCSGGQPAPPLPKDKVRGQVRTDFALNIRKGSPNRTVPVLRIAPPGACLTHVARVIDGEAVNGNAAWYEDEDGNFFWSGATSPL
jgi:N-acetylmuramoyl-L-alanine amidase